MATLTFNPNFLNTLRGVPLSDARIGWALVPKPEKLAERIATAACALPRNDGRNGGEERG